jgi:hypothetical protein
MSGHVFSSSSAVKTAEDTRLSLLSVNQIYENQKILKWMIVHFSKDSFASYTHTQKINNRISLNMDPSHALKIRFH